MNRNGKIAREYLAQKNDKTQTRQLSGYQLGIRKKVDKARYTPSGKPYDYTPRNDLVLDDTAEEIARITGICGETALKVIGCETEILGMEKPSYVNDRSMAARISRIMGIPRDDVSIVLDAEDIILSKLGILTGNYKKRKTPQRLLGIHDERM